ncbi:MAG: hypothetical protein IPH86_13660 [bacterium]|nr:hypothetical protein [bacterium]
MSVQVIATVEPEAGLNDTPPLPAMSDRSMFQAAGVALTASPVLPAIVVPDRLQAGVVGADDQARPAVVHDHGLSMPTRL